MGYTVNYKNKTEEDAINDVKSYMGDKFDKLVTMTKAAIDNGANDQAIVFNLSFIGINGYPANVLIKWIQSGKL